MIANRKRAFFDMHAWCHLKGGTSRSEDTICFESTFTYPSNDTLHDLVSSVNSEKNPFEKRTLSVIDSLILAIQASSSL